MAHVTEDELLSRIADARSKINPAGTYVHYRHPELPYRILHIGLIEAREEPGVIYQRIDRPELIWVRPVQEWLETVEVDGKEVHRFREVV